MDRQRALTVDQRSEQIEIWRQEQAAGADVVLGIFHDGVAIGGSGLHRRRGPGVLEIGYWVHAGHVRLGYATEVAGALTETALEVPGIDRVEIHHDKANTISGRVPERLGYTKVAEVEDEIVAPAETGISCIWAFSR